MTIAAIVEKRLIADIDTPGKGSFNISQQAMIDLRDLFNALKH